jgi:hypothetical protein
VKGWTLEQAQNAQRQFEAAGGDPMDPAAPMARWLVQPELAKLGQRFEAGQNRPWQLFTTIHLCACHELPLPVWVAAAFSAGSLRVMRFDTGSLDVAFGSPLPKHTDVAGLRERRKLAMRVFTRAIELHTQHDVPIDEGLWQRLRVELKAGGHRISNSGVRDLYYFAKSLLRAPTLPRKRKAVRVQLLPALTPREAGLKRARRKTSKK